MQDIQIIDITPENIRQYGICGYKNLKKDGYPQKISWIENNYPKGLRIKSILTSKDGIQGTIEYIPGEYCWRPVKADGYMFIHCIFAGFKSVYKGKGYASMLIDTCLQDALNQNKFGVAVVTRKGSFMIGKDIFLKNGFEVSDTAAPDFELLVKKIKKNAPNPEFTTNWDKKLSQYKSGLTIIRANQCPYTIKNVNEIIDTAQKKFGLEVNIIESNVCHDAQAVPCAFGVFCIIFNGEVISHHPISNTRFINIMNSILN